MSKNEETISCQYYLMYYLLIMSEAADAGNELADVMNKALENQQKLLGLIADSPNCQNYNNVDLKDAKQDESGVIYHPVEIDYWKYANYLRIKGKFSDAEKYYEEAARECFYPDIRLMMQSLVNKYNNLILGKNGTDAELLNALANSIEIVNYNLKSRKFSLRGINISGCVGDLTVKVKGSKYIEKAVNTLLNFGTYSGVGIQTSIEMGEVLLKL